MDELEQIVQNMIDAGEPEANIKLVIESYKPSKKKVSASPAPKQNSASTTKTGSSGALDYKSPFEASKTAPKQVRATSTPSQYKEGSMAWTQEKLKQSDPQYTELYNKFKQAEAVPEDKVKSIQEEVDAAANNEGILNKVKSLGRSVGNYFTTGAFGSGDALADEKAEAKKQLQQEVLEAKKSKKPAPSITNEDVLERAKNIAVQKRVKSESETQVREFLADMENTTSGPESANFRKKLQMFQVGEQSTLQENDKLLLEKQNILRPAIENSALRLKELNNEIKLYADKNQEVPDEVIQSLNTEKENYQKLIDDAIKTQEEYVDNKENLGTAIENLDVFKRDYSWTANFLGNLKSSVYDLSAGVDGAIDYATQFNDNLKPLGSWSRANAVKTRKESQDTREEIMKPIAVDDINSVKDFGKWLSHTVIAQQVPIYAMVATGVGGIGAIGVTSLGQKYEDMQDEMMSGTMDYSQAQLMGLPAAFAATEMASATVDRLVFKNAGRVFRSASETERKVIADGFWSQLKETSKALGAHSKSIVKGTALEGADEAGTQIAQNLLDKYIGGNENVGLWDNVKDAAAAGAVMGGMIPTGAAGLGIATRLGKSFSKDKTAEELSETITSLQQEFENPELSEASKKVLEKKLNSTQAELEKVLAKTATDISKMPNKDFESVISIENEKSELQRTAQEIEADTSISEKTKDILIKDLKDDFTALEDKRIETINKSENDTDSNIPDNSVSQDNPATNDDVPADTESVPETQKPAINETAPKNDIAADGNVSTGTGGLQQDGGQQSVTGENLSTGNDFGASESQLEVDNNDVVLYHGTPHEFSKFSINKIGSGEGAQAFGSGLYFTNEKSIAEGYANSISTKQKFWDYLMDGNDVKISKDDFSFINESLGNLGYDGEAAENANVTEIDVDGDKIYSPATYDALAQLFSRRNSQSFKEDYDLTDQEYNRLMEIKKKITNPQLYEIEVTGERNFMEWRESVPESIAKKLGKDYDVSGKTGQQLYNEIKTKLGGEQKASEYLLSKGVSGITYKSNAGTGGKSGKGRNYVVFDENAVVVKKINEAPVNNNTSESSNIAKETLEVSETPALKNSNLQGVAEKTYDAKKILTDLFDKIKNNTKGSKKEVIGVMSDTEKQRLTEISGLPFRDITTFEVNPSDLRHIYNDHYQQNEKDKGQNIPLTDEDIAKIPDILRNPTDIEFLNSKKTSEKKFMFIKKDDDGVFFVVEAYGKKGGVLSIKTFYKRKKDIKQRPDATSATDPRAKAISVESPSSDANIQKDSDTQNITTLDKILNQEDVKGILDFLDDLKLDPNDLKATLPFLPQTWNTFIEAVKLSIKAGNTIRNAVNEAIRQLEGNGVARDEIRAVQARFEKLYNLQEEKATALKNADIAEKRLELGLEPREAVVPLANKDLIAQAEEKIKSGYDVEGLIDEVLEANSTKTLNNEEVIILKQYQLGKEDQLIAIGPKIVAAAKEGKQTKLDKLTDERNALVDDIDRAYRAGERSGTITARALQARRIAILHDYSLANMLIQRRKANNGEKLTTEQIESTTAEYQKIKEINEKLQAKVQNLEEENNRLKAEKQFQKVLSLEKRKRGRKEKIADIDKSIDDVLASLKKTIKEQQGRLSSNALPVEMIPDIARLAVLYAQKGIVNLNQVVDNIHASLVDDIPNLTKSDIEEIIGSYDYEGEAKNNARLETLKKRTSKRIEELRKKLEEKNFAKKELNPVKLDKEAQKLKDELRQAKFEWDKALESDRLSKRTKLEKASDFTVDLLNVPRSVMASIDYSAPLRQGLVMTINHPILASRAFTEMFKQGFSQLRFDRWMENLTESPEYELLEKAGLYIANTNKSNAKLSAKEEQFMSNLANKIPVIGAGFNVKVKGKPVKVFGMNPTGGLNLIGGSERAYVSYLNKLRVDVFLQAAGAFQSDGLTIENKPELYEALATYVNAATGRGDIGKFEDSAGILNALFFSPRLIASRIRLLTNWANPMWYAKTPARVRRMYALDMLRFIAAGTSILALASLAGADVEENPLSTDFGKIKIGDTRWDIWGGFQQFVRYISQISYGAEKKGNKIIDFGKSNRDKYSRTGAGLKLVRSKLAPVPATIVSWGLGTDPVGNDYDYTDLPNSFMPLFASDLYNAIEREGPKAAATTGLPAVFGIGVITYDERKKK